MAENTSNKAEDYKEIYKMTKLDPLLSYLH